MAKRKDRIDKKGHHHICTFPCTYKKCEHNSFGTCRDWLDLNKTCMGECKIYNKYKNKK